MSLTRDLRSEVEVGLTGPVVGEMPTFDVVLTGDRLVVVVVQDDSLDSNLLGKEIGLGIRDLEDKGRLILG